MRLDALMRARGGSLDSVLKRLLSDASRAKGAAHGVVTDSALVRAFGAVVGADSARAEVQRALRGGVVILPPNFIGGCAVPVVDTLVPWDPGFDVDPSLRAGRALGVRVGGPAEAAGLRDSMRILGASIYRGDASKTLVLRVRAAGDTADRRLSWLPASKDRVAVQQWRFTPGTRCSP
jgi:predicted metalloprotease with PDZ domain